MVCFSHIHTPHPKIVATILSGMFILISPLFLDCICRILFTLKLGGKRITKFAPHLRITHIVDSARVVSG